MDLFDDLLDKARDAFDVAVKATEDVVDTGKQKFNIASLESSFQRIIKLWVSCIINSKRERKQTLPKWKALLPKLMIKSKRLKK